MSARHATPRELEALCAAALERARAHGASLADACAESSRAFTVRAHGGSIESLKQSGTRGLGLRAVVDGAVGFASGTDLSPTGLDDLARRAVALARYSTSDPANGAPDASEVGAPFVADMELFDPRRSTGRPSGRSRWRSSSSASRAPPTRARDAHRWRQRLELGRRVRDRQHARRGAELRGHERFGVGRGARGRPRWPAADRRRGHERAPSPDLARWRRWRARGEARGGPDRRAHGAHRTRASGDAPDIAGAWLAEMADAWSGESLIKQSSWLTASSARVWRRHS